MALDHGKVKPLCQRIKSEGLSKFAWGEVGVGAKGPFPSHSIDHQAKGSSIGHQANNLLLATKTRIFYWPPSQEPSPSLEKGGLGTWELSSSFPSRKQFQSNLENVCFNKVLEEGRKDQL
jgi:hypothetical protein